MKKYTYPSVLAIAGFDGSGGAGIQADIKTISALGCYATSVLTALPVQNTQGVRKIYPIPVEAVADQIEAVMDDIQPEAIKIGMVHTPELVETIVRTLGNYNRIPIVFDPVMVATSGHRLIETDTIDALIEQLLPHRNAHYTQYGRGGPIGPHGSEDLGRNADCRGTYQGTGVQQYPHERGTSGNNPYHFPIF